MQAIRTASPPPELSPQTEKSPEESGGTYIWVVLGLAVAVQMAGSIVSQGVYILVPFWMPEFGLAQSVAALTVTVMNGGQIASMIFLGRAIDRYGERLVVSATMVAMGLTAVAAAILAPNYFALLILLTLLGMFYASVQPGGTRAILRWFPPRRRGLATGFRQAAVPLGTAAAAFILPALAASSGWRMAVLAQGLIGIAGGAVFWFCYRESATELAAARQSPKLALRELIRILGEDRGFWPVLLAGIAMSAFQFTFTANAIPFVAHHFGFGLVAAASLFGIVQVIGIPGRVLLPYLSDRMCPGRRERSLGWTMGVCTAAIVTFLLLPANPPRWALYANLGVIGLFGIGWFPLYVLQIAEIAPRSAIASTVSFATTLCMVAMALAPFVFGAVVDLAGYRAAWITLIVPVALFAMPLLRLPARTVA